MCSNNIVLFLGPFYFTFKAMHSEKENVTENINNERPFRECYFCVVGNKALFTFVLYKKGIQGK